MQNLKLETQSYKNWINQQKTKESIKSLGMSSEEHKQNSEGREAI